MGRQRLDLDGKRFGKLIAMNLRDGRKVKCICDCGTYTWTDIGNLTTGHTKSCGCGEKEARKIAFGLAARNVVLDNYRRGAQKRGLSWELTDTQFDILTSDICHFCKRPPSNLGKTNLPNGLFVYNGIDRLDNNAGYTTVNVVTCCKICNRAKRELSLTVFKQWIQDVVNANS